jgi:hypothetical protein
MNHETAGVDSLKRNKMTPSESVRRATLRYSPLSARVHGYTTAISYPVLTPVAMLADRAFGQSASAAGGSAILRFPPVSVATVKLLGSTHLSPSCDRPRRQAPLPQAFAPRAAAVRRRAKADCL